MIHAFRKVAREIHRRSVWQVLFVYLVGGWLVLQAVALATDRIGLPSWTPTIALTLLAVGLPFVVATAVVQGGLPTWLRIEDLVDPNELEGLTPAQVHVVPEHHSMYGAATLTWRNAVLLGVMSAALLVTSVVAYLTMWALGIGPVGSLLAQGRISEEEPIVVAEFENHTDAMGLGAAVTDAFIADLSRSAVVTVMTPADLAGALDRLGRPSVGGISPTAAHEVAAAEGIRATVHGEVARASGGYLVTATITLTPATAPVARFQEFAETREALLLAIDALSERVRSKFGESLRAVRSEPPLTEVYGSSFPAPAR